MIFRKVEKQHKKWPQFFGEGRRSTNVKTLKSGQTLIILKNVGIQKRWDIRKTRPQLQNNDNNDHTYNNKYPVRRRKHASMRLAPWTSWAQELLGSWAPFTHGAQEPLRPKRSKAQGTWRHVCACALDTYEYFQEAGLPLSEHIVDMKNFKKSIQKPPKIFPKSSQNSPKIHPKSSRNSLLELSWAVLAAS